MKSFGIWLGTFLIALSTVKAEMPCKDFITETTEKTMKSFFECKKEAVFKSEEDKLSKMHCLVVCALKKHKFLSPDGYVDEASLLAYVEKEIPASVQSRAMELMLKCQQFGTNLDPEEERCLSYAGLIRCALSVVFQICSS